jgi:endonuclease/exonuclease/phosphatase family metal-dependent hydrolase
MKLITWNVQWCCGVDGRVDVGRIVDTARALADFDVLCLQEVAVNYPRLRGDASHDQPALLQTLLSGFTLHFGAAVDELAPDGRGRQRFGNLVASRLPVLQVRQHALPYPADGGVRSMPRAAVCATLRAPWGPLRVMSTHLEYESPRMRSAQARELLRLHAEACAQAAQPPLADDDGSPFRGKAHTADLLLGGDFNLTPDSADHRLLTAGEPGLPPLVDAWRRLRGAEPHAPTFCLHDHQYGTEPIACDFVFASASVAPRLRRIGVDGATQASDHQPVLVELADD